MFSFCQIVLDSEILKKSHNTAVCLDSAKNAVFFSMHKCEQVKRNKNITEKIAAL